MPKAPLTRAEVQFILLTLEQKGVSRDLVLVDTLNDYRQRYGYTVRQIVAAYLAHHGKTRKTS